jgi:ABC-type transport system substrate-binding protein
MKSMRKLFQIFNSKPIGMFQRVELMGFRFPTWLVIMAVVFSGCSRKPIPAHTVFRYNESGGITSLDPAFARTQSNTWAVHQLFDGLVRLDDQLIPQPALAYRWVIDSTATEFTFFLRADVWFHEHPDFGPDGRRRMEASDVVYSLKRLTDPDISAPGAWVMRPVASIVALDSLTVRITLRESFPPFLSLMAMPYAYIVPEEIARKQGRLFGRQPIGTGPFYLKRWIENEKLVLRRNNRYFESDNGEQLPYLESVAISFVPDKQAAFMEFMKGNLDLLSGLDAAYKDELLNPDGTLHKRHQSRFGMFSQSYLNTEYLGILMDSANTVMAGNPLRMRKVRQALNFGFDREAMMKFLRNNIGTPATAGFIPPGLPGALSLGDGYVFDPDRAAHLLAEAGFPEGKGLPILTLQTNASYLDICEFIQSQWARLGIRVKVDVNPPATLRQAIATSRVPFFRGSWIADYADAENYLSLFYAPNFTPNGPNYTHFSNPDFDAAYRACLTMHQLEERIPVYQYMDSLVMHHAPVIPLYYDQVIRFFPLGIEGLAGNGMNLLDLRRVRKPQD